MMKTIMYRQQETYVPCRIYRDGKNLVLDVSSMKLVNPCKKNGNNDDGMKSIERLSIAL